MAGIERQPEPFDVVAQDDRGIGVLGDAAGFGLQTDDHPLAAGNRHQAFEPFDLGIEGGAQFARRDDDGHDFGGFGQAAAGGELLVVELAFGGDVDAVGGDRQPIGLAAGGDRSFQIGMNCRRLELLAVFVDGDFDAGVFQIDQSLERRIQRQIGKTLGRGGNKHA